MFIAIRAQETKDVRLLGEHLWEAQELFIREIAERGQVRIDPFERLDRSVLRELHEEAEKLAGFHE